MGSIERKMRRQALKEGHKRLKKEWKKENIRRAQGVYVPVETTTPTSSPNNNTVDDEPGMTTHIPTVPNVASQRLPMLGRPPSLSQYGEMLARITEQRKASIVKQKEDFLKRRAEEEKNADTEWKDEP